MKQITIDTGSTTGVAAISIFQKEGLQRGDTLRIVRRTAQAQDAWVTCVMLVMLAANYFLKKKPTGSQTQATDELMSEVAKNRKGLTDLREDLRSTFDVNVNVEPAVDEDREFWNLMGMHSLARAYSEDEPDISNMTLLEPNPDYVPWKPET